MKRTRRIEIVRYTRRVTLNGEGGDAAAAEAQAVALLLEVSRAVPRVAGEVRDCAPRGSVAEPAAAPGSRLRRLMNWLRRG